MKTCTHRSDFDETGCNQPEKLPNGDLLVPVRYQREADSRIYTSVVVRCRFNGRTLEYVKHGSELTIPRGRGLYEPSMIQFSGESFLTLRADDTAYVTKGRDGIHYQPIREWSFDDGTRLGSYNTQQHWVRVGGACSWSTPAGGPITTISFGIEPPCLSVRWIRSAWWSFERRNAFSCLKTTPAWEIRGFAKSATLRLGSPVGKCV